MASPLRKILPLYFVIFFGFLGYSMMITVFTPMLLQDTTSSQPTILLGFLLFLYPFGQFISSPILGALSDHLGRKKLLVISLFCTCVSYLLIALSIELNNLTLLMIFLFIAGIMEGNVTLAQSAIADVTSKEERSKFFGYIYFSASLAFIVGPLLGGKLAFFSYSVPFWATSALLLIVSLWILLCFKETFTLHATRAIHYGTSFTNLKHVFQPTPLRPYFFVNFLLYLAIFGFFRSYPMYIVDEFHVGISKLSEYIAWVGLAIILINLGVVAMLAKKWTPFQITLTSALALGIAIEILIFPSTQNALWIPLFVVGVLIAINLPTCAALLSSHASHKDQGKVLGNNQSLQFFAESVSGLVAGLIAALMVKLTLIILGILSLIAGFYLLFLHFKENRP